LKAETHGHTVGAIIAVIMTNHIEASAGNECVIAQEV
jgi:hypothetical protein